MRTSLLLFIFILFTPLRGLASDPEAEARDCFEQHVASLFADPSQAMERLNIPYLVKYGDKRVVDGQPDSEDWQFIYNALADTPNVGKLRPGTIEEVVVTVTKNRYVVRGTVYVDVVLERMSDRYAFFVSMSRPTCLVEEVNIGDGFYSLRQFVQERYFEDSINRRRENR